MAPGGQRSHPRVRHGMMRVSVAQSVGGLNSDHAAPRTHCCRPVSLRVCATTNAMRSFGVPTRSAGRLWPRHRRLDTWATWATWATFTPVGSILPVILWFFP